MTAIVTDFNDGAPVNSGDTGVKFTGTGFGEDEGTTFLVSAKASYPMEVTYWSDEEVQVTIPDDIPDSTTLRASLVPYGSEQPIEFTKNTVSSVADLRLYEPVVEDQSIILTGHTEFGVGGGTFLYDSIDSTSEDDNGIVIVTTEGARWKRRNEGYTSIDFFGGGIGEEDDEAIYSALTNAPNGNTIVFTSGTTYNWNYLVSIDNNSDLTGTTKSYHIKAYGAKILKGDFTGSALLKIEHNPSDLWYQNRFLNDSWDFLWEGGDIDANGFNQNFRMAANIRDGTGDIDETRYTTTDQQEQALIYQALQSKVFGDDTLPWYVNPLSTNTPHTDQDGSLIRISGAETVTFRDLKTRRRHEEGLEGLCCREITFDNCHDYDSLPTNDQFQIWIVGEGNFTNGQQHFHMRTTNGQTLVKMVVSDASGLVEGDIVTDSALYVEDDEHTQGTIYSIEDDALFLHQVVNGDGFAIGSNLVVNDVTSEATISSYVVLESPVFNVSNCSSSIGNSGVGFMNVDYTPLFSTLNITNYSAMDLSLIGVRTEHVHNLNISNSNFTCSNILSDPTGTLDYWTIAGMEVGASTRNANCSNLTFLNCSLTGNNYSKQRKQMFSNIQVIFAEGVGRINSDTLLPSTVDAIQSMLGRMSNIDIISQPYSNYPSVYPIDNAVLNHRGAITGFYINGCNTGISQCERISDGKITNVTEYAIDDIWTEGGDRDVRIDEVQISTVAGGIVIPDGNSTDETNSSVRISDCVIEDVQGMVFNNTGNKVVIELRGNTFKNWGLDSTLGDEYACLLGFSGSGGAQAEELYLIGNTFRAESDDSRKTLWYMNSLNTYLVERSSIYAKSDVSDWSYNKGGDSVLSRDNATSKLNYYGDGIVLSDSNGVDLGAVKFQSSRIAYNLLYDSSNSFRLYADDNSSTLTVYSGDILTFETVLVDVGGSQAFVSGDSKYLNIDSALTMNMSSGYVFKIDGNTLVDNDDVSSYLDGSSHTIYIEFTEDSDFYYIGSSSSGSSEQLGGAFYNISYTSTINDDRFYVVDDDDSTVVDSLNGHDATINFESVGSWVNVWLD